MDMISLPKSKHFLIVWIYFIEKYVVSQQVTDVWKGLKTAELLIEQYLVRVESKSKTFSATVQPN